MRLLIVDDSKIERMILKEMLQSEGYVVQEAENGQQALEMALLSCPDMIISDILMPVMDGFKFCHEIRADNRIRNIPFVFYTGTYTKLEDEEFAFKMGADRFLVKSMGWEAFFRELQDVIKEKERGEEISQTHPSRDEKEIYQLYNKRLIKKLEDKVFELEKEVEWRKKLEKQLYDSQESLQMALDGTSLGMWDWNVQTGEAKFNQQWAGNFGYTPEELLPHVSTWENLLHPDDRTQAMAELQTNLNGTSELYESEHRLKDKAGKWHWFLAKGKVLSRNEAGDPLRHVGTFLDITDRMEAKAALEKSHAQMEKQVEIRTADLLTANQQLEAEILLRNKIESALRESEERFRMLAENARDVIYRMSLPDGCYEYVSPAATEIFGYTPHDFYQSPLLIKQILHPDWHTYFEERWEALLKNNIQPAYEFQIIHKSGAVRWLHLRNVLIHDLNGNPAAIEGIASDITEIKQAELKLTQQNKNLDELVAERTSKLKVVTESLEKEKERYSLIFNTVPIGIFHYDMDGGILECNNKIIEMIRSSREQFVGLNILKSIENEHLIKAIKESLAGKTSYTEGKYTSGTGSRKFYVKADFVPVLSSEGVVTGGLCVVEDTSKKIQAEKALQKSEEKYRTILENIEDGYYEVDLAGNLTFFNRTLCRILGYSESELKGMNYRSFMDSENAGKTFQAFNQVFKIGTSLKQFDWKVIRGNGSERYLDTSVTPVKDANENITGFRGITRDVTDRKLMEKFLAESEERYRLIFNNAPVGIVHYDSNGIFTEPNKQFAEIFGAPPGKVIGLNMLEDTKNESALNAIKRSLAGKSGHYEGEYTSAIAGRTILVQADYVPVFNDNHTMSGGICVAMDITDRKKAEDELRHSHDRLRKLSSYLQKATENERKSIAREIHDDLGQSLTAIKMEIAWLQSKIPEDQAGLYKKAGSSISLIDSAIQSVKRISSDLRPGLLDDLGLSAAIEWQAGEYQKRSGINIQVTIDPEEIVLGEELSIAIFRVCQEALTNVVRHSGATNAWVDLKENNNAVDLVVADNGSGITKQATAKKNSFGLTGMRERILAMGGGIKIFKTPKGGTKVAVQVPVRSDRV